MGGVFGCSSSPPQLHHQRKLFSTESPPPRPSKQVCHAVTFRPILPPPSTFVSPAQPQNQRTQKARLLPVAHRSLLQLVTFGSSLESPDPHMQPCSSTTNEQSSRRRSSVPSKVLQSCAHSVPTPKCIHRTTSRSPVARSCQ